MSKPQVTLNFTTHWCARHLEPFRSDWPRGASIAMLELFNGAVARDEVANYAGSQVDGLDAALREFSPLCCFIGDKAMEAIYEKALPGDGS